MRDVAPLPLHILPEVGRALQQGSAVVALESTILTHGLSYPHNLATARAIEAEVRAQGAIPATIGVIAGKIYVGLQEEQLAALCQGSGLRKLAARDLAPALLEAASGGTTVSATLRIAAIAGIQVFATGGIGGVHRGAAVSFDVSADLAELARQPVLLVCAGAKAILDLRATLEYLETLGVLVAGYQSNDFPAFYARESGLTVEHSVADAVQGAQLARTHWSLRGGGILLANPVPAASALPFAESEALVQQALAAAEAAGVTGKEVTPFLLRHLEGMPGSRTLDINVALVRNNAKVAAQIAVALAKPRGPLGFGRGGWA